jgi:uncharacterized protein (TIGR02266 family)
VQHERRRHPRLDIPLEADLQLAGVDGEYSVTMQDLSAGGASLLTSFELPVGTDIQRIHFGLPQGDDVDPLPIGVVARVARCRELAGLGGDTQYLVGIQFLDITRELFDVIQQFVFQGLRNSQTDRVPIERPIAIRFDRFDDFVDEVSLNLSTTGMFIQTRDPRPPGAVFKFQFQLGEDFSLIEGRAEVVWRRRHREGPDKLPGMGVKFLNLDVPSQQLINRLIKQRQDAPAASEAEPQPTAAGAEPTEPDRVEVVTEAAAGTRLPPPELEEAEATIVSLSQVNELRNETGRLTDELEEARRGHERQLQELRAGLEDRQAAVGSELEERLRDAETAHRESERQRGALADELDGLKSDLDTTRGEISSLQAILEKTRGETDQLKSTLEHTDGEIAGLKDDLERTRGENEQLKSTLERTDGEIAGLKDDLERTRGENGGLQRQLADRTPEDEIQRLSTESGALQATNARLLADLDRVHGEADDLRRQLEDRTAEQEIERLAGERDELQKELGALQTAHDGLRADFAQVPAETDLQGEVERLQQTNEAAILQLKMEHAAELEKTAFEARKAAGRDAVGELESARQELTAAQERGQSLESELDSLHQERAEGREAASGEAAAALATAHEENERLGRELASAEESRLTFESELQRLRDEARQTARHAEEREVALRAEIENTALEAAGGMPPPQPHRGRRIAAVIALLLIGGLLGTLAVSFFEPLGSLAGRLRPEGETTQLTANREAPDTPASGTPPSAPSNVPPAPEPQPQAQPAAEPGPDSATAEQAVHDWAAAWSDQRVDDYLECYADSFEPPDGQDRDGWAANRRQRIERPRSIDVGVEAARTVELAADRVSVSFDQAYSSDSFSDRVRKTLLLVWQDGGWKIAEERVIE